MIREARELNLDALVGPTHHYGGLSLGNLPSQLHRHDASNPREAALQGLEKMSLLAGLGVAQAVLPPHERPDLAMLRRLGFSGSEAEVLEQAARQAPDLLSACSSASAMWAANAATVSPAADAADGRVHFTPANLTTQFHRSLEPETTSLVLRRIFANETFFTHHEPLPQGVQFRDEGAANHLRLAPAHGAPGVEVFVFNAAANDPGAQTANFPARQTRAACEAIARLHGLNPGRTVVVRQNPEAVAAGVFHNDVVCLGNEHVLIYHAQAFAHAPQAIAEIREKYRACAGADPLLLEVDPSELDLGEAVASYLFNSQLVTAPGGAMSLVCPEDCRRFPRALRVIDRLREQVAAIQSVHYIDVRQSMRNGGGPACLRLRVVVGADEAAAIHGGVMLTPELEERLKHWIERHYRDRLCVEDLADPMLLEESRAALDALTQILGLGSVYPFQMSGG